MCGLFCIVDIIVAIFVAVTVGLYIPAMGTLIKFNKKLKSSFFVLSISAGVADIWLAIHTFAFMKIPKWFFNETVYDNTVFATASKMGLWYIYLAQVFGIYIATINRYTALAWPMSYKQIWTNKMIALTITAQWLIPLPTVIPLFFPCCYSYYKSDLLYPSFINPQTHEIYFIFDIILEIMFLAPTIIIMYALSFYKALMFSKQAKKAAAHQKTQKGGGKKKNAELRLAFSGATVSLLYLLCCFTFICFLFGYQLNWIVRVFFVASDLLVCSKPWTLLAFSSDYRRYFVGFVMCKSAQQIENAVYTSHIKSGTVHPNPSPAPSPTPSVRSVVNTTHD